MRKIKLKIKAADKKISAVLDYPTDKEPEEFALLAHCFSCGKDLKSYTFLDESLTDKGIAVLRFDFTGLGQSTGDFGSANFESNIEDLIIVSEFLRTNFKGPKLLIGHSLGGAAIIHAANQITSAHAVATIGTPYYPEHLMSIIDSGKDEIKTKGKADVIISGRDFTIGKHFYDDLKQVDMKSAIENMSKPLCVMHSSIDETVGVDQALKIFNYANYPKCFISLDPADHLLLNKQDAHFAGKIISEWAKKYF